MSLVAVQGTSKRKLSDTIIMAPALAPLHQSGAKKYKTGVEDSIPHVDSDEGVNVNFVVVKEDDLENVDIDEDIEEENSDYEETDNESESSDNQENTQSVSILSTDQLELLESALSSYQFLPRTTTEKVLVELQETGGEDQPCTRRMVRNWFSGREVMTSTAMDRCDVRRRKLAMCDHAEGSVAKTGRKVRFCEEVRVRSVEEEVEDILVSMRDLN
eukprot:GFUD01025958.1.p1 GENE.GFUD01025958.1~~GFUD01025958.1.p1  ORF type:complete len:216 (-),score=82.88 GFUD01025958.1:128-775(-)